LSALLLFILLAISLVPFPSANAAEVRIGEPSPMLYRAPRQITFVSDVQTKAARDAAAAQIKEVYKGPDISIAINQLRTIQDITDFIGALRQDAYITDAERREQINAIPGFSLDESSLETILQMSDESWRLIAQETARVVDQIMREEIRSDQVGEALARIPRYTSYSLSDQQRTIVQELAGQVVVANTFFDAAQTEDNRQAAADQVAPVLRTIQSGESIVREGEIVTPLILESLQALGYQSTRVGWQTSLGMAALAAGIVAAVALYIVHGQPQWLARPRRSLLLVLLIGSFSIGARFLVPGHTLIPYIYPIAAIGMLACLLLSLDLALVCTAIGTIVVAYHTGGSIELIIYSALGGIVGAVALHKMDSLFAFLRATIYVALTNTLVILAYRFITQQVDNTGLAQLLVSGISNAVFAASITFVGYAFIGRLFGIATSLQLLELARPTHPLIRRLVVDAPGTYHHCIILSNMAERAAVQIGADPLLTRVGAYYHDIGKVTRPYFFAENQSDGVNPHDQLDPHTSAEIIISHVTEGLELARQYRLPDRVTDFIAEHHGTTLVAYFYRLAVQDSQDKQLPEDLFRYHGPRPQSKETAIIMLADSIEALVRANHPSSQVEVDRLIMQVVNERLISGQLDESDLTLKDLGNIRKAFSVVLQGVFHPRIRYPEKGRIQRPERPTKAGIEGVQHEKPSSHIR